MKSVYVPLPSDTGDTAQSKKSVMCMRMLLDCIEKNPGITQKQLCLASGINVSTARKWAKELAKQGFVIVTPSVRNSFGHATQTMYRRGPAQGQFGHPARAEAVYKHSLMNRKVVKAQQIGMTRDAMLTAFFGPARKI